MGSMFAMAEALFPERPPLVRSRGALGIIEKALRRGTWHWAWSTRSPGLLSRGGPAFPHRRWQMMGIAAAAPMEMMFFDGMVAKGLLAIVLRSPTVRARLHNNQCGVVGCEP